MANKMFKGAAERTHLMGIGLDAAATCDPKELVDIVPMVRRLREAVQHCKKGSATEPFDASTWMALVSMLRPEAMEALAEECGSYLDMAEDGSDFTQDSVAGWAFAPYRQLLLDMHGHLELTLHKCFFYGQLRQLRLGEWQPVHYDQKRLTQRGMAGGTDHDEPSHSGPSPALEP